MTLAPNRLRLLSGSKLLLWSLVLLTSCELFQKLPEDPKTNDPDDLGDIQGPVKVDPETGEIVEVTVMSETMDTVKWKDLSEEKFPPITSPTVEEDPIEPVVTQPVVDEKDLRRLVLMLPFMANRFSPENTTLYETSKWALQFYGGAQLALQDLEAEGIRLKVDVLDSQASEQEVDRLFKTDPTIQKADIIIGPYRSANVRLAAEFAKTAKIPVVSPYSAASNLASSNPYFIQVNPSLKSHAEAILRHVRETYPSNQIVLVVRDLPEETARLALFQEANRAVSPPSDTARLKEYIVTDKSADFSGININPYLLSDRTTVFIVPSWSNESFVYSFLRKLNLARQDFSNAVVYGMPQWTEFGQVINYELFEDLHVHISSYFFADEFDPEIKAFNRRFFDNFGILPKEEGYLGYEVTKYFGALVAKEGKGFIENLDARDADNLFSRFEFRRTSEMPSDNFRKFDLFENKYVHILEFRDFYFQPAR